MKLFWCLVASNVVSFSSGCTAFAASGGASIDGVAMTAHSADCTECDSRVGLVRGKEHGMNGTHDVYGLTTEFPRRTNSDRASIYYGDFEGIDMVKPLAEIPEAENTFGIWESTYGLINEEGLTMGESSCDSKIPAAGIDMPDPKTGKKGKAKLCIRALIQLGLERCKTAVCSIKVMGALAEEHGFYGESFMGGEALTIADATGDAWIFHVIQDYSTNTSAIWAAQRVPQGHVSAIANEFTIKEIPQEKDEDYMHSKNMFEEAKLAGFWNEEEKFEFNKVFGKASLPTYTSIRLWVIFNMVAPSLNLEWVEDPFQLPFSVPVDQKLSVQDVMDIYRTHYENTQFDMSKGILSGPFQNPNRIEGGDPSKKLGAFTRGISISRTAYTHIGYAAPNDRAASFYGTDQPATTVFVPLLTKTLKEARNMDLMETTKLYSRGYQMGRKDVYDRKTSAWWTFDFLSNFVNLNYQNMTQEMLNPAMEQWQTKMIKAYETMNHELIRTVTDELLAAWNDLTDAMIVRYNDGYFNYGPNKRWGTIGYSEEYLKDIGYNKQFYKPITVQDQIESACSEESILTSSSITTLAHAFFFFLIGTALGYLVARKTQTSPKSEQESSSFYERF